MPVYACICLFAHSWIRLHVSITVYLCNPAHPHVDSLTVYVRANMHACIYVGWMDGWMDACMHACMDGWMDGWLDGGWMHLYVSICIY